VVQVVSSRLGSLHSINGHRQERLGPGQFHPTGVSRAVTCQARCVPAPQIRIFNLPALHSIPVSLRASLPCLLPQALPFLTLTLGC